MCERLMPRSEQRESLKTKSEMREMKVKELKMSRQSMFYVAIGLVLTAVVSRLVPHAPNLTALTAVSLTAAAMMPRAWMAALIPVLALLISDLALGFWGFYQGMLFVYIPFAIIALMANRFWPNWVAGRMAQWNWPSLISSTVLASLFFFFVSNFGSWLGSPLYTQDLQGLLNSYAMALPFLLNQLMGDLFYSLLILPTTIFVSRGVLVYQTERLRKP